MINWYAVITIGATLLMLWAAFFNEDEDAKRKMQDHTPLLKRAWGWLK